MSYDNWKLSNPQDDGWTSHEVTSCCGVEERIKHNLCDDSEIYYCSECGEIELEWAVRRAEERELDKILPENKLYNQWWDMTKSKFWQEFAQCDVTYHGITTRFKKLKQ